MGAAIGDAVSALCRTRPYPATELQKSGAENQERLTALGAVPQDSTYSRPLAFPAGSPNLPPMLRYCLTLIVVLSPCAADAEGPTSLSAHYATYAAGLHVADIETGVSTGPRTYQMSVTFHTTGVAGFFYSGSQTGMVRGSWQGSNAVPAQYIGEGTWRGANRLADIEYEHGQPKVRQLVPPNETEREPVPENLQALSLIH